MNQTKQKSMIVAVVLILLAVYLIVSKLGYAPALPFFKIAFTVLFIYTAIMGFVRLHFFQGFLSLAIIGCIYDKMLGIERLTPWTLFLAAILLGIAFDMIFKGTRKKKNNGEWNCNYSTVGGSTVENCVDMEQVRVDNTFSSVSKYVNSEHFVRADIDNSFGECNVYFNNAILAGAEAYIHVDNSFGETNLYLPHTWRIEVRQDTSFASANVRGHGSSDLDAPLIHLELDCSFGEINVYFE